jgi:hypothetical protein
LALRGLLKRALCSRGLRCIDIREISDAKDNIKAES